jgi:hypothetical protein
MAGNDSSGRQGGCDMDFDPIIRAGLALVALVGLLIVLRMAIVPDGVGFEDLFGSVNDHVWPHGVQEEEPVRWRPECLRARRGPDPTRRSSGSATHRATDADQRLIEL